jgi:hypothetical protein
MSRASDFIAVAFGWRPVAEAFRALSHLERILARSYSRPAPCHYSSRSTRRLLSGQHSIAAPSSRATRRVVESLTAAPRFELALAAFAFRRFDRPYQISRSNAFHRGFCLNSPQAGSRYA